MARLEEIPLDERQSGVVVRRCGRVRHLGGQRWLRTALAISTVLRDNALVSLQTIGVASGPKTVGVVTQNLRLVATCFRCYTVLGVPTASGIAAAHIGVT